MSTCSRCGFAHQGVGQSPDHPALVSGGWVLFYILLVFGAVAAIIFSGEVL